MKRLQQALRRTYLHYVFAARDQDVRVSSALSDSRIHENAQSHRIGLRSCAEGIIQNDTRNEHMQTHTRPRACRNRYTYLGRRRARHLRVRNHTVEHERRRLLHLAIGQAMTAQPFIKRIGRLLAAARPDRQIAQSTRPRRNRAERPK